MNQQQQSHNTAIIVAIITGVFVCAAAVIGLGVPFSKNLADRFIPPFTPVPSEISNIGIENPTSIPTTVSSPISVLPSPLPTSTIATLATSVSENCQTLQAGAGKQFNITMQGGCYYHFNVACHGCLAGQENNYLIYYSGNSIRVTVPEGSTWQYGSEPTANQFSSDCATSSIDFWPAQLPAFLNISGVRQIWPCGVK